MDLRQAGCLKARFPRRDCAGLDGRRDAEHRRRRRRRRPAGSGVFGRRRGAGDDRGAGGGTILPGVAGGDAPSSVRTRRRVADERGAGMVAAGNHPVRPGALDRRLDIDVAADASFSGRRDAGVWSHGDGRDRAPGLVARPDPDPARRRLLLHDAIRLDGAVDALLQRPAIGRGARAVATLVYVAPDAGGSARPVRLPLPAWRQGPAPGTACWSPASLAPTALRAADRVVAALTVLRQSRPLPRVWLC